MNNDQNAADFAMAVKAIRENIIAHCEFQTLNARIAYAKYKALVEQGFTEEQALKLCEKV